MATKYGQEAIAYWKDKQKRNKIIKRTLLVVLVFAIGYGTLIHYFG